MIQFIYKVLVLFSFGIILLGCSEEIEPGYFQIDFDWRDDPPEQTDSLGVHVWLERDGLQVAESAILNFSTGMALDLNDVPNGSNLVAIAEILESTNVDAHILYFGRSESFTLKAGKKLKVSVALHLTMTPYVGEENDSVWIVQQYSGTYIPRNYTNITTVGLSIHPPEYCEDPCRLLVSNRSDFSVLSNSQPILSELEPVGDRYILPEWDLNLGSSDLDGTRTVYVKFVNAYGYESNIVTGQIVVDRVVPSLLTVPLVERCDGYSEAKISENELYIRKDNACLVPNSTECSYHCGYEYTIDDKTTVSPIRVNFSLTELVKIASRGIYLYGNSSPREDTFTLSSKDTASSFVAILSRFPDTEGTQTLKIHLADLAGNEVTIDLAVLHFDYKCPTEPLVNIPGAVIYNRVPYGSDETSGEEFFSVEGKSGAFEPFASAIIYSDFSGASESELNRATVDENGSFSAINVTSDDNPELFISQMDRAGNESSLVLIRDVTWKVTLGSKIAEKTVPNPVFFGSSSWFPYTLQTEGFQAMDRNSGIVEIGGGLAETTGAGRWIKHLHRGPVERVDGSIAYDSTRGVTVLFGGHSSGNGVRDTWEWDGINWYECTPVTSPAPRKSHAITYDPKTQTTYLYGGYFYPSTYYADFWKWDGINWRQIEPLTGNEYPGQRLGHALAMDTQNDALLLFGGKMPGNEALNDLWSYQNEMWMKVCPGGTHCEQVPAKRYDHAMAFDNQRKKLVIFGGAAPDGYTTQTLGDLWEWDGETWDLRCDGVPESDVCDPAPSARSDQSMVFDSIRNRIVMYGGDLVGEPYYSDELWEWDGESWDLRCDGIPVEDVCDTKPSGRYSLEMTFDSGRGRTIVFGGHDGGSGGGIQSDLWEWDGTTWEKRGETTKYDNTWGTVPDAREMHTMAYDERRKRIMMFGAFSWSSEGYYGWNGVSWDRYCDGEPDEDTCDQMPINRMGTDMTYDNEHDVLVLFGGCEEDGNGHTNELWEWNGEQWELRCDGEPIEDVCGDVPIKRSYHRIVYDSQRNRVVLFGGWGGSRYFNDTWEWDGERWEQRCDGEPLEDVCEHSPPALSYFDMSYDPERGKVVLFGGYVDQEYQSDVWEWDGSDWLNACDSGRGEVNCSDGPDPRYKHTMAYDRVRKHTLVFGGATPIKQNDLWGWDGTKWFLYPSCDLETDGDPSIRFNSAIDYFIDRDQLVLFSGQDDQGYVQDTWHWESGVQARGGQMMLVPFSSALGETNSASIEKVDIRWLSGGTGALNDELQIGSCLLIWDEGMWKIVDEHEAPSNALEELSWTTNNLLQLSRMAVGNDRNFGIASVPFAPNGNGSHGLTHYGTIATDYVEMTIWYRLNE